MSVDTRVDEKISEAKTHLDEAYKCLLEVLDSDTSGHNSLHEGYIETVEKTALKILNCKRKL